MAKCENQKLKLLYIKEYMEEKTDEEHPVTVQKIIEMLESHQISAERKSVYRDIACLRDEYGMDIITKHGAQTGYFLGSRTFEQPELQLLIDAVQASRFLTEKKSRELIKKLSRQGGPVQSELTAKQLFVQDRVKNMDESIYYNVDKLHDAISRKKKVSFSYYTWGVDKKKHFKPGPYVASPYALIWDDENYYLIAHSPRHGLTHYRVDKMDRITCTQEDIQRGEEYEKLDLSLYSKGVFSMFRGDTTEVKLRFENWLANVAIDRFGRDVSLVPEGEDHFVLTVPVEVSPYFFSWVASFGTAVKILYPQAVIRGYCDFCRQALEQYE